MPFVHGKNATIWMWDASGTCRNMSGDKNSITLAWDKNNPETTTFGKVAVQRIAGLHDATLSGAGIWNSDASSGIDAIFSGIMAASAPTLVHFSPAGSQFYSACYQMSKYDVVGPVNGVVAVNWEFQLASGSMTLVVDSIQAMLNLTQTDWVGIWPLNDSASPTALDYSGKGRNATYVGSLTLGQTGIGDGRTAIKNATGAVGFYSAGYVSEFNGAEGTAIVWIKVEDSAHWSDLVDEYILSIFATSGQIRIRKYPAANLLRYTYVAGGVTETLDLSRYETRWIQIAVTWSKSGEIAALYVNGTLVGTSTTLGVWSGTLSSGIQTFGAFRHDAPQNQFKGYMGLGAIAKRALTGPEITSLHDVVIPTTGVFVLGDSKTGASYPWYRLAMDSLATDSQAYEERPVRYFAAGWKVADLKAYVVANLAAEWQTANRAWINIGANDLSGGTSEASFKVDLISVIDAVRAKYPSILVYIARPWRRGYNTEAANMKAWIATVAGGYSSGVYVGPDETVWLENGDDGATYTIDGVHYNVAGITEAAAQWAAL